MCCSKDWTGAKPQKALHREINKMDFELFTYITVGLLAVIAWSTMLLVGIGNRLVKKLDDLSNDFHSFEDALRNLESMESTLDSLEAYARDFDEYGLPDKEERKWIDQQRIDREIAKHMSSSVNKNTDE